MIVKIITAFLYFRSNFENVIKRAMIACKNSRHSVEYDFAEVSKIVEDERNNFKVHSLGSYFSKPLSIVTFLVM